MSVSLTAPSESADFNSCAEAVSVVPTRPLLPVRQRPRPSGSPSADSILGGSLPDEVDAPGYKIGYRKPPKHSQFRPGHSGNPRGRPRAAKGLKTIVRETLTGKVMVRTPAGDKRISRMEAVMQKTVELAMKGNPRALAQLITLYGAAVPEAATSIDDQPVEELSATDMAILDQLKASWGMQDGEDR